MNTINPKKLHVALFSIAIALSLAACGIASEVVNHEANDKRLLKPGALDVPIAKIYERFQYKFLDHYKITHDFVMSGSCHYYGPPVGIKDIIPGNNYAISPVLDIFEKGNHTYTKAYQNNDVAKLNPTNIDRYTRPEWQNGTDSNGKPMIAKGFQPMCFETWQGTQHFLTIYLNKRKLINPNIYGFKDGVISHQTIGNNHWDIQKFDYQPYAINSSGRLVESWVLPVADTGYTFIFELGANQDSLKYPQAHAQMQAIFKHLIESVKIEPSPSAQ